MITWARACSVSGAPDRPPSAPVGGRPKGPQLHTPPRHMGIHVDSTALTGRPIGGVMPTE
jgi:hypothetical protein